MLREEPLTTDAHGAILTMYQGSINNCHCTFLLVSNCSDMLALCCPVTASPGPCPSQLAELAEGDRQNAYSRPCWTSSCAHHGPSPPAQNQPPSGMLYEDFWMVDPSREQAKFHLHTSCSFSPRMPSPKGPSLTTSNPLSSDPAPP